MSRHSYPDQLTFITIRVVAWACVFIRREYQQIVVDSLAHCRERKGLDIYAYVLMPNHLHAVVLSNGRELSDTVRDFKAHTARHLLRAVSEHPQESRRVGLLRLFAAYGDHSPINTHEQFWQTGYYPTGLWSPPVIQQKIDYIHQNPVRAGFVDQPSDYLLSSAHSQNPLGVVWSPWS